MSAERFAPPVMDIQSNWDEVFRSSSLKKFWVSYRVPGQGSQEYHLSKGSGGELLEAGGNLVLEDHTPYSLTVSHAQSGTTTRFVRPRRSLAIHDRQLLCIDVSGSGELGVSSSEEGRLWVWESDTAATRRELSGHVGDINSCQFFPSGVVVLSGGADLRLKIWSIEDGSCARSLTGHSRGITDTTIIDRGRNFLSVSKDGKALLWDCGSARCLASVASLTCEINSCAVATNSHLVVSNTTDPIEPECGTSDKLLLLACEDGSSRVYDIRSRNQVQSYSTGSSGLGACEFLSPELVLVGSEDGTVTMLDLRQTNAPISSWSFGCSPVRSVVRVDGDKCAAAFRDGSVLVWHYQSPPAYPVARKLTRLTGPDNDMVTCMKKSTNFLYSASRDGTVRAYHLSDL